MPDEKIETWSPADVKKAFDNNEIVLIDVRTPQEFMLAHIEGALLGPMATFKPESLPSQNGKRIVLHCGSGARSGKVAQACLEAGLDCIAHMDGGMAAWKKAGFPYVGLHLPTGTPRLKADGSDTNG